MTASRFCVFLRVHLSLGQRDGEEKEGPGQTSDVTLSHEGGLRVSSCRGCLHNMMLMLSVRICDQIHWGHCSETATRLKKRTNKVQGNNQRLLQVTKPLLCHYRYSQGSFSSLALFSSSGMGLFYGRTCCGNRNVFICAVPSKYHPPHVTTEHLNWGSNY